MPEQPKLSIKPTGADILIETISWIMLGLLWCLVLYNYARLPEIIPTHYNIAGEVDDTGSKSFLFILPALGTVIYISLTILNRYPHIFNYPDKITPDNAYMQYANAVLMVRMVKLSIGITFFVISLVIIPDTFRISGFNVLWIIPFILVTTAIPLVIYFIRNARDKNRKNGY